MDTATPKDAEETITSCSIITTAVNADVRFVHDRMSVILNGSDAEAAWRGADVDLERAVELVPHAAPRAARGLACPRGWTRPQRRR